MIEQIKKALENATPDWYDNGNEIVSQLNLRVGIGGFLTEEDSHLAANAPEWLRYLIDAYEECREDALTLHKQVEEMQKTLEDISTHVGDITSTQFYLLAYIEVKRMANKALQSLKEDKPNDHKPML